MGTTKEDIGHWFDNGVAKEATHMIIVCDSFSYEDYPVYVMADQDVHKIHKEYTDGKHSMQRVMEVYSLKNDKEKQLAEYRAFNLD